MREIKFRAWDNLDKTMDSAENTTYIENNRPSEFNEFVFMQYTGLKDKNDVEIYEGDIAIIENYNHHGKNAKKTMVIYYDNLTAQYCCKTKQIDCKIDDLTMNNQPLCFAHSIEIVGNIYENPDSIKG